MSMHIHMKNTRGRWWASIYKHFPFISFLYKIFKQSKQNYFLILFQRIFCMKKKPGRCNITDHLKYAENLTHKGKAMCPISGFQMGQSPGPFWREQWPLWTRRVFLFYNVLILCLPSFNHIFASNLCIDFLYNVQQN